MQKISLLSVIIILMLLLTGFPSAQVWERLAVDSSGYDLGYYFDMTTDAEGNPHFTYYDDIFNDLYYATLQHEVWHRELVDSVGNTGEYCKIAIDGNGAPHLLYWLEYQDYYPSLGYATRNDTGWVKEIVESGVDTTYSVLNTHLGIAISSTGEPVVNYIREDNNLDILMFSTRTTNGWQKETVDTLASSYFSDIRITESQFPVIAYMDWWNDSTEIYTIRVASKTGSGQSWEKYTLPDTLAGHASFGGLVGFDVDEQGRIYLAYKNRNDVLKMAVLENAQWQVETITEQPEMDPFYSLSLAIDRQEEPAVAFLPNGTSLYFSRKSGGQWQHEFVQEEIAPFAVDLDFNASNFPYITIFGTTPNYTRNTLFLFRYWPGTPVMHLPESAHNFGQVWAQSYAEWGCPIVNLGEAPLIINQLTFSSGGWDSTFTTPATQLPLTVLPQDSTGIYIRFRPPGEGVFRDTLLIFSNDSLSNNRVALQGEGIIGGGSGTLKVTLNDVYIDHNYGIIRSDVPLAGARIALYQGGALIYGPVISNSSGMAELAEVFPGEYDIRISSPLAIPKSQPAALNPDSLVFQQSVSVGPGINSRQFTIPDSLFGEKYQQIYDLTHIEKVTNFDISVTSSFGYYYGEAEVTGLLQTWQQDLPPDVANSLSRLVLTEDMVGQLFHPAYSIGLEFSKDIGELVNLLFNSDRYLPGVFKLLLNFIKNILTGDPIGALVELVVQLIAEFLESQLFQLITEGIQQAASALPQTAKEIVMAAWHDIVGKYAGWDNLIGSFSQQSWDHIHRLIFTHFRSALFQLVYINIMTEDDIITAKNYSQNFSYEGEFSDAYFQTSQFIADKRDDVENIATACQYLRGTAHLFMVMQSALEILGLLPVPGTGLLNAIQTIAKITAYTEVLTAVGLSAYSFFSLPEDMEDAVEGIYHPGKGAPPLQLTPNPPPAALMPPQLIAHLQTELYSAANSYDSVLQEIKQNVARGNAVEAILSLEGLMAAEQKLQNKMRLNLTPVYAGAKMASDSLAGFRAAYDSLRSQFAEAGVQRMMTYLYVVNFIADTSEAMKTVVNSEIGKTESRQNRLTAQIDSTLQIVSHLPLPAAVCVAEVRQNQFALSPGKKDTLQFQLQNVGGQTAKSIAVNFNTNGGLQVLSPDSVDIGDLPPGSLSPQLTFIVAGGDTGYSKGTWQLDVYVENGDGFPASGSYRLAPAQNSTPPTGGKLSDETIYSYPNPFNPDETTAHIRFSLSRSARVTIKIYDAGGNLVIKLLEDAFLSAKTEQEYEWDGRRADGGLCANGTYFVVIESSEGERAVGKIALLK